MPSPFQRLCFALWLSIATGVGSLSAVARADHRKKSAPHAKAHRRPAPAAHRRVEGAVESAPKAEKVESAPPAEQMTTRGPARLDFDDRLVQGQSNKAGAIFLYDRKNLPLRSMVRTRTNFRDEIEDELPLEASQ
ncbi:MAG: hypothetical protein ACYDCL_03695 [Myxococcales bacterium]